MGLPSLTGGFSGGAGSSYQGGSATNGDQTSKNKFSIGGFSITAAPAWAGGNSSGGQVSGAATPTSLMMGGMPSTDLIMVGGAVAVVLWALMRKK